MGELKFRQGAVPQVLGLAILILSAALWTLAQAPNTINTIAGGGTNPTSPTAAYLGFPSSVVRDASNNVYIAAPGLEIVYKVSAGGQLSIYAGTGIAGFSGDGSPANAAKLNFPLGLALDSAGDLYIADAFNNRIRRVDASTGVITYKKIRSSVDEQGKRAIKEGARRWASVAAAGREADALPASAYDGCYDVTGRRVHLADQPVKGVRDEKVA